MSRIGRAIVRGLGSGRHGGRGAAHTRDFCRDYSCPSEPTIKWARTAQERKGFTAAEIAHVQAVVDAVDRGDVSHFLIDSGAPKHMCKDTALFINLIPTTAVVVVGDGTSPQISLKGSVNLHPACGVKA